jgi:hypothetical protein
LGSKKKHDRNVSSHRSIRRGCLIRISPGCSVYRRTRRPAKSLEYPLVGLTVFFAASDTGPPVAASRRTTPLPFGHNKRAGARLCAFAHSPFEFENRTFRKHPAGAAESLCQYQRGRSEATFTQRRRARPLARASSRGSGDQRVPRGGLLGAAVGAGEESVSTATHRAEHVARRTTITGETA